VKGKEGMKRVQYLGQKNVFQVTELTLGYRSSPQPEHNCGLLQPFFHSLQKRRCVCLNKGKLFSLGVYISSLLAATPIGKNCQNPSVPENRITSKYQGKCKQYLCTLPFRFYLHTVKSYENF